SLLAQLRHMTRDTSPPAAAVQSGPMKHVVRGADVIKDALGLSRASRSRSVRQGEPMRVIRGKRALVTGAASGIGRAIALALAREGADLYLLDVDRASLADVVADTQTYGTEVIGAYCDLARSEEISAAVKTVLARWEHLDILINNAGVSYHGKTEGMPAAR